MKTKYYILSLLFLSLCLTMQAQTKTITTSEQISVTSDYVDNASMTWYVTNPTEPNKPVLIKYNIGTEHNYDYVTIYSIDASGNEILLVGLSGTQSGSISSVIPTGKIKITFTCDGSVCYLSNTALYTGVKITFSSDNTWVASSVANTYTNGNTIVNGNVGIGVLNPSYKLEVNGTTKITGDIIGGNAMSLRDNARFWVTSANVPTLNASNTQYSMTQYGIAAPLTTGSAELWLSGNAGIRMFTAGNPNPNVTLSTSGNLGIGTITPNHRLEVVGSADNTFEAAGFYNIYSYGNANTAETRINIGKIEGDRRQPMGAIGAFPTSNYDSSNGNLVFYTRNTQNMVERMRIDKDGNVGIGTATPEYNLDVVGNIKTRLAASANATGIIIGNNGSEQSMIQFNASDNSARFKMQVNGINTSTERLSFYAGPLNCTATNEALTIGGNGNVKIGTSATDAKTELLTVFGVIHAKEVQVDLSGTLADYVFAPSYKLMPLHKVEEYVKTNSHLPEIPSAAEVKEKGMSIGDMQNKLLQKVEELTLYVIQQQKRIEELEKNQK